MLQCHATEQRQEHQHQDCASTRIRSAGSTNPSADSTNLVKYSLHPFLTSCRHSLARLNPSTAMTSTTNKSVPVLRPEYVLISMLVVARITLTAYSAMALLSMGKTFLSHLNSTTSRSSSDPNTEESQFFTMERRGLVSGSPASPASSTYTRCQTAGFSTLGRAEQSNSQ